MNEVLEYVQKALAALNDPIVKTVILFAWPFLAKRFPGFQAKAIPFLNLAASILLGAGQVMTAAAGILPAGTHPAAFIVAAAQTAPAWQRILDAVFGTVVPVIAATGAHSSWKNTGQWLSEGYMLFRKPK